MKYSEKMNSLKKGEGVPLLNFEGNPLVPLLNFEGGLGVSLLNFKGVPSPTFKLWGGSQFPDPRVPRSQVLGSCSHFYIMPFKFSYSLQDDDRFLILPASPFQIYFLQKAGKAKIFEKLIQRSENNIFRWLSLKRGTRNRERGMGNEEWS